MTNAHWLGRALLAGFLWVFLAAAAYLLLDTFGLWQRLPAGTMRAINVATGLVLLGELLGHLALVSGRLPERPAGE